MLKTLELNSRNYFYYDLENQTIARFPSKSNLLQKGSDNSLYFGLTTNEKVCNVFKNIFNVRNIGLINHKDFVMRCGDDVVDVKININDYQQIQVKICKDGTMGRLTLNYSLTSGCFDDFTQWLLVVDFKNNEIRFKDPKDLKL